MTGLRGPTQMTFGPDGRLYVAQLAGGESAGTGQVVRVDRLTGDQEILIRDLFKPTGVAVTETDLWVMAGDRLLRAPLTGDRVGKPETVLRNLPNNGRSLGTLTLAPDGALLYETSGALTPNGPQRGSGTLWRLRPTDPQNPEPLATGLKGAYAHAFADDGTLYATELGDDPMNGAPPPDELNVIHPGADYGWPRCYGRRLPARNNGGTAAACAETKAPLALFARGASPTSVVVSPFAPDELFVALWTPSRVVSVDAQTGEVTPFLTGVLFPQHLLVEGDTLLVSSFAEGVIYQIEKVQSAE
jgi:glucose/arabinose dehydrogenase